MQLKRTMHDAAWHPRCDAHKVDLMEQARRTHLHRTPPAPAGAWPVHGPSPSLTGMLIFERSCNASADSSPRTRSAPRAARSSTASATRRFFPCAGDRKPRLQRGPGSRPPPSEMERGFPSAPPRHRRPSPTSSTAPPICRSSKT